MRSSPPAALCLSAIPAIVLDLLPGHSTQVNLGMIRTGKLARSVYSTRAACDDVSDYLVGRERTIASTIRAICA